LERSNKLFMLLQTSIFEMISKYVFPFIHGLRIFLCFCFSFSLSCLYYRISYLFEVNFHIHTVNTNSWFILLPVNFMYEKYHQKAEFFSICLRDLTSPLWLIQIADIHNYFKKISVWEVPSETRTRHPFLPSLTL
jgi:hypothetical protein